MSEHTHGEHSHLCATCGKRFIHADESCEAFFFGACPECLKSEVEPDAPPATTDVR